MHAQVLRINILTNIVDLCGVSDITGFPQTGLALGQMCQCRS